MWLKKQVNRKKKPTKSIMKLSKQRKRTKIGLKLSTKDLDFAFEITNNISDEE
ncbi:MAG: hypothetical protein WB988_06285 [Candidatus Nitrosopolaris sp.]|jgi:hypothetical protein